MRILYLIGNGFDLHVGLKTSYFDFLKYYLHQPFPADIDDVGKRFITRLKADINQNFELWSDLELQYGKHFEQTEIQSRKNSIWNKTTNKSATNNMKAIFVHNLKPATPADVRNKIDDLFKVSSTCSVWLR